MNAKKLILLSEAGTRQQILTKAPAICIGSLE